MFDEITKNLTGVRHVPNLKRNLISVGTLDKSSYHFKEKNGYLKVLQGALTIIQGCKKNGLYIRQENAIKGLHAQ